MNEKSYIPGTRPEWNRELPDEDDNSLVDKHGNNYDNGYNFDERDEEDEIPEFDPEAAKRRYEEDHPGAVKDVEKARMMAEAEEDFYRSSIPYIKETAEKMVEGEELTEDNPDYPQMRHELAKRIIERGLSETDSKNLREAIEKGAKLEIEKTEKDANEFADIVGAEYDRQKH